MLFMRFLSSKLPHFKWQCKIRMSSAAVAAEKYVYVNHNSEGKTMRLSFKYASQDVKQRQYTLNRSSAEKLHIVLNRIAINIANIEEGKKKRKKKKKNGCPDEDEEAMKTESQEGLPVSLECNGVPVPGDMANSDAWKDGSILQIGEHRYSVAVNAPTVISVRLPKYIMAGFPVHARIELEHCDFRDCEMTWFMTVKRGQTFPIHEVYKVSNKLFVNTHQHSSFLMPKTTDLGRYVLLRVTPCAGSRKGMPVEVMSASTVEAGPGFCPFEARQFFTTFLTPPGRFRCISYNILADVYADTSYSRSILFPYCASYALDLCYRKQLFTKEILGYKGDLICLQEVDRKVFREDLEPILEANGFLGYYTEKCSPMAEGVACFFRSSKFRELEVYSTVLATALVEEKALSDITVSISQNPNLRNRILNLPTALQVLLLEPLDKPKRLLLVANTHLYYHPNSDNIRLFQAYSCIRLVEWLRAEYTERYGMEPAVIFAGDFNSCPAYGVYKLFTRGYVSQHAVDWYSNEEEAVFGLEPEQHIPLASACGTPAYTNYTKGFQGCLDYIFYDYMQLIRESVVPMPPHQQVAQEEGLPSVHFPSDHVAQVATLRWL
uniref:2',5'-phosphodiesterase 12 n=1 Tax=Amblyomma triste TaxID=251400 RepID=A0A023GLE3_AMBTT